MFAKDEGAGQISRGERHLSGAPGRGRKSSECFSAETLWLSREALLQACDSSRVMKLMIFLGAELAVYFSVLFLFIVLRSRNFGTQGIIRFPLAHHHDMDGAFVLLGE